jgi:TIR domain
MSHLFISYARKDRGFVEDLVRDLEKRGISSWIDRHDIPGGATWRSEISNAITDCSAFLIILSPESAASDNVKRELALAESHHRRIIPIRYKPSSIPPEMELALSNLQWVDFDEPTYEDAFARLVHSLQPRSTTQDDSQPGSRPKLVYWISGLYLVSGAYVLLACALFLIGLSDQGGEITEFFKSHSRLELGLVITIAVVNTAAAIVLFRMKAQAVQLVLVSWVLNTIYTAFTIWSKTDSQARLGPIAIYAVASYVLYYTYRLKQDGKLDHQAPPAEAHQTTNAGATSG